jgi:RNA polymerase sigma factor (sigma-70 family)
MGETPLTQGGPGLPGALRSLIAAQPQAPPLAREPSVPATSSASASPDSSPALTVQLFEQAARSHARRLLAIARAVVGNRASPEDVVQQALVNLFQHRDRYDWHQPGGLMRRAVVNEALRILRQPRMTAVPAELPGRDDAPVGGMIDGETVQRVREAIDRLPEHFRAALVLCEYEGMAYVQIAEVLGASVPQVKTWLHRGRRQLARMLKDYVAAERRRS